MSDKSHRPSEVSNQCKLVITRLKWKALAGYMSGSQSRGKVYEVDILDCILTGKHILTSDFKVIKR